MMLRALNGSNSVYLAVLFTRGECLRSRKCGASCFRSLRATGRFRACGVPSRAALL